MKNLRSVKYSAVSGKFAEIINQVNLKCLMSLVTPLIFCVVSASAEERTHSHMSLSDLVRFISISCKSNVTVCRNGLSRVELRALPEPLNSRLSQVAYDQAQIWADTILEGDYVAEGPTQLGQVYQYTLNGQVVAYHITYSEKAWDVSECAYDGLRSSSLTDCRAGRIVESSYVSADFIEAEQDEKNYAHFVVQ